MSITSVWRVLFADSANEILYIEDESEKYNTLSITNDAENVLDHVHERFGKNWRVIYKDTQNEWWEVYYRANTPSYTEVGFKPWQGLVWDILQRP